MLKYSTRDVRNLTISVEVLLLLAKDTIDSNIKTKLKTTAEHLLDEIIIKE
jgi:hypothetical protein